MDRGEEEQQHYIKKEHITNDTNGEYQDPLATIDPVPITFGIFKEEEDDIKEADLLPEDVFQDMSKHADLQHKLNEHEYGNADNTLCSYGNEEDLDNKSLIFRVLENNTKTGSRQNVEEKISINDVQEYSSAFECNDDMTVIDMSNKKLNIENNDKIYTCGECKKTFSQYCYLKKHITATHQSRVSNIASNKCNFSHTDKQLNTEVDKSYACAECDKRYASFSDVRNHNKTVHLGNSYYKCVACNKTFFQTDKLKQHSCLVHKYECQICKKQFLHPSHLKQHIVGHNNKIPNNLMHMEKKYICDVCHKSFTEFKALIHHIIITEHFVVTAVSNESFNFNQQSVAEHKEQKYVCYECGLKFFEFSQIKNHINKSHCQEIIKNGREMSIDTEGEKHACKHCDKTYYIIAELTRHIKTVHLGSEKYECHHCHKTFSQLSLLKVHIILVHKYNELYACSSCNERYYYYQDLNSHISEKHSGVSYCECVICNILIKRSHHLTRHYKNVHKIPTPTKKYQYSSCHKTKAAQPKLLKTPTKLVDKNNESGFYACSSCNERHIYHQDLTSHIKEKHSGIGYYKCVICSKIIKRAHHLTRHYKDVHRIGNLPHRIKTVHLETEKYECDHCHKTFSQLSLLKVHIILVHKNNKGKLYACGSCNERYSYHQDLNSHISEKHSGVSNCKCVICNKVITRPYNLTKHYKDVHKITYLTCPMKTVHLDAEKKYQCDYCHITFSQPNLLEMHSELVHKNNEGGLYACSSCDKRYPYHKDLTYHISEKHSGNGYYKCIICNKVIKHAHHLVRHYKDVHENLCLNPEKHIHKITYPTCPIKTVHSDAEKKYQCDYCHITFSQPNLLEMHSELVHKNNEGGLYACSSCDKRYPYHKDLTYHISEKHSGNGNYKCIICNKVIKHAHHLVRHYKDVHENLCLNPEKHLKSRRYIRLYKPVKNKGCVKVQSKARRVKVQSKARCVNVQSKARCVKVQSKARCVKVKSKAKRENKFECEDCNRRFFEFSFLKAHIFRTHSKKESLKDNFSQKDKIYACSVCNEDYAWVTDLKHHINSSHSGIGGYQCKLCNKTIFCYSRVNKHMYAIHKYKELNYFHYSKIFSCGDCGRKYSTFDRLHKHINGMHLRIGGYKCKQCNKIYTGLRELKVHRSSNKHKNFMKFECEHCKKKFSHLSLLRVHIGVHSRSKNIECAHCGKKFFLLSLLKDHINKVHLKIKNFQCEHCGKNFSTSAILQNHVNTVHKNLRKFECTFCCKKFKSLNHLQNHIVCVHERVKKFVCEHCGSRFLLAHHLRNHVNAIHNGITR